MFRYAQEVKTTDVILYSLLCMLLIRQLYRSIALYVRAIYIRSNLTKRQN